MTMAKFESKQSNQQKRWQLNPVIALFLCHGGGICHVMETSPYNYWFHYSSFILYTVLKQTHED